MSVKAFFACILLAVPAGAATAGPPRVAVDIPPLHALVARVMSGIGAPDLIVPPGASPHGYAMRPSEARALSDAQVIFWVGETLTPWLARSLYSLGEQADIVTVMDLPEVALLAFRDSAEFEAHDHEDEHGHADTPEGNPQQAAGFDPHLWLDPLNGQAILGAVAAHLSLADPENAPLYAANAAEGQAELGALHAEIAARLAPLRGKGFIVFHDAYHYFEARFGIEALGAVALSDASVPGAARLHEIRRMLQDTQAGCVFSEPQFPPRLIATLTEGTGARAGVLDPLGAGLEPGAALYPQLLRNLADGLVVCLE